MKKIGFYFRMMFAIPLAFVGVLLLGLALALGEDDSDVELPIMKGRKKNGKGNS